MRVNVRTTTTTTIYSNFYNNNIYRSFYSCQISSTSKTGFFIVSAHRLTNITLLTLVQATCLVHCTTCTVVPRGVAELYPQWRHTTRNTRDRSITHSLQIWVSIKCSISQLECIFFFVIDLAARSNIILDYVCIDYFVYRIMPSTRNRHYCCCCCISYRYDFFFFTLLSLSSFWTLKPWSHVSSLLPPGSCLQFLSRIWFSNPTARRFFIKCC